MKQKIHINDQGELLLIEVTDTPKSPSALAPLAVWEYYDKVSFPSYQAALTSAIEKGIKFRDQQATANIIYYGKPDSFAPACFKVFKGKSFAVPNSYTAEVEHQCRVNEKSEWEKCTFGDCNRHGEGNKRKVAVLIPLKQSGEPGNEAKKEEGWISVEDRLPEFGVKVLVFVAPTHPVMEGYVIRIDRRVEVSGKKTGGTIGKYLAGKLSSYAFTTGEVSHWQPLPPPPSNHLK